MDQLRRSALNRIVRASAAAMLPSLACANSPLEGVGLPGGSSIPRACSPFATLNAKLANFEETSLVVLGDSWIDSNVIGDSLKSTLSSFHGIDGGSGWGDIRAFNLSGVWAVSDSRPNSFGLDLYHVETSDPFAQISMAGCGTEASLHYVCSPGSGSFEYNYNGQGWIGPIDTNGGSQLKTITAYGGKSSGKSTFRIRVKIPGVGIKIVGVDFRIPGGLTVHELGNGGMHTAHLVSMFSDVAMKRIWQDSLKLLDPSVLVVLFGTNDQTANTTPSQYAANMVSIKDCAQQAVPGLDVVLWSAGDNGRTPAPAFGMNEFAAELDRKVNAEDCSFRVVNGYLATGPYSLGEPWDNQTHLTDSGDVMFTQSLISMLLG